MLRNLAVYLLGLCLALWLGGLAALFMLVSVLFVSDRATAVLAAPRMFAVFDSYQMIVGGVALAGAVVWWLFKRSTTKAILVALVVLALAMGVLEITWVAPNLNGSRNVDKETFDRFHRISRWVYQTGAIAVLAAGGLFIRGLQTERIVAYVSGFPVTSATPPATADDQTSSATAQA